MSRRHRLVRSIKPKARSFLHAVNKHRLSRHRLIFSINSGRSGSGYLAELLNSAVNAYGFHEPSPQMIGSYLDLINRFPYEETFKQRSHKASGIKDILLSLPKESVYCETSHMFIKTFFDVVIEAFPGQIEVIACRRYVPHVLKSFIELKYFANINNIWPAWMSSPNAVTAAIPCISDDSNLDHYDSAIAYLIDIEARLERFKSTYPHIKVHEVRVEQFKDLSYTESIFKQLSLAPSKKTLALHNKSSNTRGILKERYSGDCVVDISYCEERIQAYINKATERGIKIPASLALTRSD